MGRRGPIPGRRIFFRFGAEPFNRTIAVRSDREAERACAIVEETIQDVLRGRLALPAEADPVTFFLSGGRVVERPEAPPAKEPEVAPALNLEQVFTLYAETLTPGTVNGGGKVQRGAGAERRLKWATPLV